MSLLCTIRNRRALAGGVALAAGAATVAVPVTAPPLAANPLDDAEVAPSVNGDTGTYESCSALFGLTDKTNADYISFAVDGTASPLPSIGDGLIPVLTVTGPEPDDTVDCIPEVGFDDEASWFADYQQAPDLPPELQELADTIYPYPGVVGYLVPRVEELSLDGSGPAATVPPFEPISLSIRIEASTSLPAGVTVSWDPTDLVFPVLDGEALLAEFQSALGGPSSELYLRFEEYFVAFEPELDPPCPWIVDGESIDEQIVEALAALTGNAPVVLEALALEEPLCPDTGGPGPASLGQVRIVTFIIIFQREVALAGLPVSVTAAAPAPNPAPEPGPVTPSFTG